MTKLPSSKKVIDILEAKGFQLKSQRGSHKKYSLHGKSVIVPAPRKEIPVGTLKSISRQSGVPLVDFLNQ